MRNVYPRVVGSVLRNALLTYGYAVSLGGPLSVHHHLVALLLCVVIVKVLLPLWLKDVVVLPLSSPALCHAVG